MPNYLNMPAAMGGAMNAFAQSRQRPLGSYGSPGAQGGAMGMGAGRAAYGQMLGNAAQALSRAGWAAGGAPQGMAGMGQAAAGMLAGMPPGGQAGFWQGSKQPPGWMQQIMQQAPPMQPPGGGLPGFLPGDYVPGPGGGPVPPPPIWGGGGMPFPVALAVRRSPVDFRRAGRGPTRRGRGTGGRVM